MKRSYLTLLTLSAAALLSPESFAQNDACSRSIIESATGAAEPGQEVLATDPQASSNYNHFAIKSRATAIMKAMGLLGTKELYSCIANDNSNEFCIQPTNKEWILHGTWFGPFATTLSGSKATLKRNVNGSSRGDPWFDIGSRFWTDNYSLSIDQKTLKFASLYKDGGDSFFAIKKRYYSSGTCTRISLAALGSDLETALRALLFEGLAGKTKRGGNVTANFLLSPEQNTLLQITALAPSTNEVKVLDLAREQSVVTKIDNLAQYQSIDPVALFDVLRESPHVSKPFLTNGNKKTWSCIQGKNELQNPYNESRDIAYRGFTTVQFQSIASAPGAEFGYQPLAKSSFVREGWTGSFAPIVFPNGQKSATLITDKTGRSLFLFVTASGPQTAPITGLDAASAKAKLGIPYAAITFGDLICFSK